MSKWTCPKCLSDMVCINSDKRAHDNTRRRRYLCIKCGTRATTYESFAHLDDEYHKPIGNAKYLARSINGKRTPIHIALAEQALGKKLPPGAEVHHIDGNSRNNKPSNLVICQDAKYHRLLHIRTKAFDECGNANWRKCVFCKQWDDPANLTTMGKTRQSPQAFHKACHNDYEKRRKQKNER